MWLELCEHVIWVEGHAGWTAVNKSISGFQDGDEMVTMNKPIYNYLHTTVIEVI